MSAPGGGNIKSSLHLFRDCLRLVKHIAGNSTKATNIKRIVKGEFKKNEGAKDEAHVAALKSYAIRGLANYLMMESTAKDDRFKKVADKFVQSEVDSIKKE